jgi:hypothetical protein
LIKVIGDRIAAKGPIIFVKAKITHHAKSRNSDQDYNQNIWKARLKCSTAKKAVFMKHDFESLNTFL